MLTETEIAAAEYARWLGRYAQILDQLPLLIETMREWAHPLQAAPFSERVGGGEGDPPAPMRLDPVDDCDDLWAAFVEYVGEVAERLQTPAPGGVGATWAVDGSVRGIPAWMSAGEAYKTAWQLVAWAIDNAGSIHALQLRDSEAHLFSLIRKLRARYVAEPVRRQATVRECRKCGEHAVHIDWLYSDEGAAVCRHCGEIHTDERERK